MEDSSDSALHDEPISPDAGEAGDAGDAGDGSVEHRPSLPPPAPSRDRGRVIALGTMLALVAVGVALIVRSPRSITAPPPLALTSADLASLDGGKDRVELASVGGGALVASEGANKGALVRPAELPRPPPAWRVASLKLDGNVEISEASFGKHGFVQALTQAGLARGEIRRVAHAFEGVRRATRPAPTDTFVLAKDKAKGTAIAFEFATTPLDVWQARLDDADAGDRGTAKKLELFVEHKRVASSLVVTADLPKAISAAGLRPEIVDAVDDALEGHLESGGLRGGVRMRIAATEDWVEGNFARVKVDAVEFVPPGTEGKGPIPLRVYFYERDSSVEGSHRRAPAAGFYDAKGRQPYRGAFRSPLPLARVTSRFNPKRMHPVLKVIMPHNGVDFGATTGTPVYAAAGGTVTTAGNGGPCGNMVEIEHGGGITTAYCHLKGFAQGLHSGQKVEAHQLVGYVGQTGRVTGPHLHFVVKKNGVFMDPLALKMDGVRVLPPSDRDAFARRRTELDGIIDGVALPSAADVPEEPEQDDKDLHAE